jgi:hypothetical protein
MTHRLRPTLTVLLVVLAACGESEREKANREALASLVQRYQGLAREYAEWAETENDRSAPMTWSDAIAGYERMIEEQQEVESDLRAVVITPKYACVGGLLARAIQHDVAFLRARKSLLRQRATARFARERYDKNMAQIYSYYGEAYGRAAGEALDDFAEAFDQAERFQAEANRRQPRVLALSDSLAFATRGLELLPMVDTVRTLPLLLDIEHDTLITSEGVAKISAVCVPSSAARPDTTRPQRRAPSADSTGARAA